MDRPAGFTVSNGALFFVANDSASGTELWKTEGTAAGTVKVKDIVPGSAQGSNINFLTDVNGTLFFSAGDTTHGVELWKSDGTDAGTVMVKDINPNAGSSLPSFITNVNGTAFFVANDGVHGKALWKSDGTANGTVLVKDVNTDPNTAADPFFSNLVAFNGQLFFTAHDATHGVELWKSDGTGAGTVMIELYPVRPRPVSISSRSSTGHFISARPTRTRSSAGRSTDPTGPRPARTRSTTLRSPSSLPGSRRRRATTRSSALRYADIIDGFGGDDTLVGLGGGDILRGGDGDDTAVLPLGLAHMRCRISATVSWSRVRTERRR